MGCKTKAKKKGRNKKNPKISNPNPKINTKNRPPMKKKKKKRRKKDKKKPPFADPDAAIFHEFNKR